MGQIIVNNAATYISGAITDVATSVTLLDATDFPDPGSDYYLVTLVGVSGVTGREDNWEIVKVTAKVGSTLTIERAQEGTTAQAWPTNTPIQMRITAGSMTLPDNVAITGGSIDGTPIGATTASTGVFTDLDANTVQLTGGTGSQGTMSWNNDEETVDLVLDGATLQIGQEIHYHVRNSTGTQITNGTPCMVTGTLGASGRLTIAPMDGSNFANEIYYIGVATEDIDAGADGKVTHFGKVRGINTAGYSDGDVLYIDPVNAGAFVTTEPSLGIKTPAAIVVYANANGTIFVRHATSVGVHDLHDVQLTSIGANEVLKYDGTKWVNNTLAEAGIATSAQGALADSAVQPNDNVTLGSGTFTGDLTVDSQTLYVDSTNNRVGVGTASPTNNLTIGLGSFSSPAPNTVGIYGSAAGAVYTAAGHDFITETGGTLYNATNTEHFWRTGSVERMRIDASGNVGIGTSSPAYRLEIPATGPVAANLGGILIGANGTDIQSSIGTLRHQATGASGYMSFDTNGSERMRIDYSGDVAIGTSTPAARLSGTNGLVIEKATPGLALAGTSRSYLQYVTGTSFKIFDQTLGVDRVTLDSSGRVGIGTASPGQKLDVAGSVALSNNATYIYSKDSAGTATRTLGMNSANTFYVGPIDAYAGGSIQYGASSGVASHVWLTAATERMRIDSAGNVTAHGEFTATSYNETYTTDSSSAGAITIDCQTGNVFSITLTENITSTTFSNPPASGTAYGMTIKVVQDATDRTIQWPASVDWPSGTAPSISSGSGAVDVFTFWTHDGGTTWYGFTAGQAMA